MIGPIGGRRLPAEIKLQICRAVLGAKQEGMTIERSCGVIFLDPRRLRRWLQRTEAARSLRGGPAAASSRLSPATLRAADLVYRPPVARRLPHRLTGSERHEILEAAPE